MAFHVDFSVLILGLHIGWNKYTHALFGINEQINNGWAVE